MAQARIALPVVVYRKSTVTAASATMVVPQIQSVWWSRRAPRSVNVPGLNEGSESGSLPQISSAAPRRTTPKPRLATTRPSSPTWLRSGATVRRSWTSATPATAATGGDHAERRGPSGLVGGDHDHAADHHVVALGEVVDARDVGDEHEAERHEGEDAAARQPR